MIYTLFANPEVLVGSEGGNPISFDTAATRFPLSGEFARHNVLYLRNSRYELANNATAGLRLEGVTGWTMVICRVVGTAKLMLPGVDWDGVTAVNGVVPTYGTALYPGFAIATVTNNADLYIQSAANNTVIDAFTFLLVADNDARLITNA